jgi:beta-1,3-galactosyltransferase 1
VPLIVLVLSDIKNHEKRLAIRSTWGNTTISTIKLVFLLGSASNVEEDELIKSENQDFNDILQLGFLDGHFLNRTLKTIMGLKWTLMFCFNAKYVLKVDDDVLVNLNILDMISYWDKTYPNKFNNSFFCKSEKYSMPNRDIKSKMFMPYEDYEGEYFPEYCNGYGFMFKNTLANSLYNASLSIEPVHLENVYIGLLAKKLESYFYDTNSYYLDARN